MSENMVIKSMESGLAIEKSEDAPYGIISGVFSSSKRDREGDVVEQDFDLSEIERNPVLLFNHNTDYLIGRIMEIKLGSRKSRFKARVSQTAFAQEIKTLIEEGILTYASHRFRPGETERSEKEDEGMTFRNNKLIEISVVSIPANLDAAIQARSAEFPTVCKALADGSLVCTFADERTRAGIKQDVGESATIVGKSATSTAETTKPGWDETDTSIRYRLRDPNLFVRLRTITLQKKAPVVKATVGPLKKGGKTKLQSLIFPKPAWTKAKAQAWYKAHPNIGKAILFSEGQETKLLTKETIREYASKVGKAVVRQLLNTLNTLHTFRR